MPSVFPAGPLRAPLPPQLARTDALIVVGDGSAARAVAADIAARGNRCCPHILSLTMSRWRHCEANVSWPLPGSADPDRFFRTLRTSGIDVVRARAFPDHHPFSKNEIET